MFITTILFALLLPFILNRMIEKQYGDIVNLGAVKPPEDKAMNEEKLLSFLLLGYLAPTALLAGTTTFFVATSVDGFAMRAALILPLFMITIAAAVATAMLETKAIDLATATREKFDNPQGTEPKSTTPSEPKSHEWMKDLHSEQDK